MKIQLTLAALLALGGASLAQDLNKKLDYKTVAIPLSKALGDLSKQAGVGLYADASLASEPIVLRLKDVTTQQAMDRLASAMSAEWRKSPDGYELWRSPDLLTKLESQAMQVRSALLKKALDEKIKATQADKPFTADDADKLAQKINKTYEAASKGTEGQEWAEVYRMKDNYPDQRVLWRVVSRLDLSTLAGIGAGDRVVLSNLPTHMQRQISAELGDLGDQFKEEHNLFAAACQKLPAPVEDNEGPSIDEDAKTTMKAAPTRFVLVAERAEYEDGLALQLLAFDADNHLLQSISGDLSRTSPMDRTMDAERAKLAKQVQNEPDIAVSPLTAQMLKFVRSIDGEQGMPNPVTDDVRQVLSHPEQLDPLATAASEAFLGVAEHRGENLVFYPDDTMFMVAMYAGKEGVFKPSLVMQTVTGMSEILPNTVTEADGWLVMGPKDPLETLSGRTNRQMFGVYLRACAASGTAPLAETAQLAGTVRGKTFPMLVMLVSMLLDPSSMMSAGQTDLNALRLYASLSPDQVRRLEDKQTVSFAELDSQQLGLVYRYVYSSASLPMTMTKDEVAEPGPPTPAQMEPTEALPNGLPADGALSLSIDSSKIYFAKMSFNSFKLTMPMDMNMLAAMLSSDDKTSAFTPELLSVEPGLDRSLHLKLAVGLKQAIEAVIKQTVHTPGGPWTKDSLPDDLKKEIAKAKLQMQQAEAQASGEEDEGEAAPPIKTPPPARA